MPITELLVVEISPPYNLHTPSLINPLHNFSRQQAAYSAYPLTFYADVASTQRYYVFTGWHNVQGRRRWLQSEDRRKATEPLSPFWTIMCRRLIDMDFDTIPRMIAGVLCVTLPAEAAKACNIVAATPDGLGSGYSDEGGESDEILTVAWISGGEDLNAEAIGASYRFILYEEHASLAAIRRRHSSSFVATLRRTSLPRELP